MKLRFVADEMYRHFESKFYDVSLQSRKPVNDDLIVDFLIEVHKDYNLQSINVDFLFKYLVYQYDYWKSKDIKGFGNHTRPQNVFGPKAYRRFKQIKDNAKFNWYNAELKLKQQYGIDRSILSRYSSGESADYNKVHLDEENEKKVFNEPIIQLSHCIDNTTLFNPNSDVCNKCSMSHVCKKILKENYPKIYKRRNL